MYFECALKITIAQFEFASALWFLAYFLAHLSKAQGELL